MYSYPHDQLVELLSAVVDATFTGPAKIWIDGEIDRLKTGKSDFFGAAFVMAPRKTGKPKINFSTDFHGQLNKLRSGIDSSDWTSDQLARVWLILHLDAFNPEHYVNNLEGLFLAGEMNELKTLYGALPFFAYPDRWIKRCSEGVRSNIGKVLDAVMLNNPYPAENLDEPAWNQLVLKAIFTDKPLLQIVGLQKRANAALAKSISDFAHERWAAHRQVDPIVWICVKGYLDDNIFSDIERLAYSSDTGEQLAAALVCTSAAYPPAQELVAKHDMLKQLSATRDWDHLAKK